MTESEIDFDQNDHDHFDNDIYCVTIKSENYLEV